MGEDLYKYKKYFPKEKLDAEAHTDIMNIPQGNSIGEAYMNTVEYSPREKPI